MLYITKTPKLGLSIAILDWEREQQENKGVHRESIKEESAKG